MPSRMIKLVRKERKKEEMKTLLIVVSPYDSPCASLRTWIGVKPIT